MRKVGENHRSECPFFKDYFVLFAFHFWFGFIFSREKKKKKSDAENY